MSSSNFDINMTGFPTGGSDRETSSSGSFEHDLSHYRWLGLKFLKYEIAEQVMPLLRDAPGQDPAVLAKRRLATFPYAQAFEAIQRDLQAELPHDLEIGKETSSSKAFLSAAGIILMGGHASSVLGLREITQSMYTGGRRAPDRPSVGASQTLSSDQSGSVDMTSSTMPEYSRGPSYRPTTPVTARASPPAPRRSPAPADKVLPLYRSKLQELESKGGEKVVFEERVNISLDPPNWEASAIYNGQRWVATASKLKQAQQMVCKQICNSLGIFL